VISGFRREGDENWNLLGIYSASSGNLLPTFRDNLLGSTFLYFGLLTQSKPGVSNGESAWGKRIIMKLTADHKSF